MAIIEPEGLFAGERLAACTDLAQLYWPRFYIGSNGFARIELSYTSVISKIFRNFKKPPESKVLWSIYHASGMLDSFLSQLLYLYLLLLEDQV